jgi:putative membrane protein
MRKDLFPGFLLILVIAYFFYTGIHPYDRLTWFMEVAPVIIAAPILILTYRKYPLTRLLYFLVFIHSLILMTGGQYTYARVPLGLWLQDWFDLARNHYDRIGHFAQGFVPAIIAREILIQGRYINGRKMLVFIVICICLAISAFYELIEWWSALLLGQGADAFLGTQGDNWDTQWDMFMAAVGAVCALLTLSAWHDRQIDRLEKQQNQTISRIS